MLIVREPSDRSFHTYKAISPRLAIRIEFNVFWDSPAFADTVDAALLDLRAAVGPKRAEVRRSDESGIVKPMRMVKMVGQFNTMKDEVGVLAYFCRAVTEEEKASEAERQSAQL